MVNSRFDDFVEDLIRMRWWEGKIIIRETLLSDMWAVDECRYCFIAEFLRSNAYLPWVLGLKCLGRSKVYKRTLAYLESYGYDVVELDSWASELVEAENDEKNVEYVRRSGRLIPSI